jgi:type II secretory pathway component GspD/PulD (secretin)
MHRATERTIFFIILVLATANAQIKFNPPKVKKQSDTTQVQQQAPTSSAAPAVALMAKTDSSVNLVKSKSLIVGDSIGLPISDSIVIPLIDFNNQPIQDVLRLLSAPYNINMSVDPGLKAKVTLRLTKIKLKEAIAFIIRENGYAFRVKNSIIQVFEPPPLAPPPPPVPVVPVQVFTVKNDLLSVDLKNAELDSVVRWIAAKANRNIITEKGMKATLTTFFTDLPIDKGLKTLFETNGLELSIKDGLTYLIPAGGGFDEQSKDKPSRMKYFVTVRKNRVSYNVNNAPIGQIVKEIASQCNLQIYMYNDLSGSITARVDSISIDEAFEGLLRNTTSTYWLSKGVYFFADKTAYEKKVVDLIPINYLQVDDVIGLLPNTITSKASIKKVKEYNAMLVEAPTSDIIEQVKSFAVLLDKPIAQILIEAWVVEIKVDKLRQYGLKLFQSTPGQATTARTYYPAISLSYQRQQIVDFLLKSLNIASNVATGIPENFAAQIDALENEGISNLISKPQIATLNGHAATITFGTTQFYTLTKNVVVPGNNGNVVEQEQDQQTLNVNMTLAVTPWVSSNNEVTMEISPTFDVPGASPGPNTPPPVNRRSLNSTVRVKSGEMIVLGGLISDEEDQTINKVPILGDIPILKWIFSTKSIQKTKTQLMIYLIPHVYYGSEKNVNQTSIDPKSFNKSAMSDTIKKQTKQSWWK